MPYKDVAVRSDHQRVYGKKHYEENKQYYVDKATRRRKELRRWFADLKRKPCERCGHEGHPGAMHWHHRDRFTKEFSLSGSFASKSQQKILDEIKKCELLCADCHAAEHELV